MREEGREGDIPAGHLVLDLHEVCLELLVVVGHTNTLPAPAFGGLEHDGVA